MSDIDAINEQYEQRRRKQTARHEAGHAVMEWLWWHETHILKIDMRGNATSKAFVRSERRFDGPEHIREWLETSPAMAKVTAIQSIMHTMAGPAAESSLHPDLGVGWFEMTLEEYHWLTNESPTSDMGRAIAAAQALHGPTGKRWCRFLSTVASWTDQVVHHQRVSPMIDALAAQLETQQTMQASTVIRIIEAAADDKWHGHRHRLYSLGRNWKRRLHVDLPQESN